MLEDDPYGLVRFEGDAAAERCSSSRAASSSPTRRRSRRRSRPACASATSCCPTACGRLRASAPSRRTSRRRSSRRRRSYEFIARGALRAEPRARPRPAPRAPGRDARGARRAAAGRRDLEPARGRLLRLARLRPGIDAAELLDGATEAGVTFVRGHRLLPGGVGPRELAARLAFSYESPERIAEGRPLLGGPPLGLRPRGSDLGVRERSEQLRDAGSKTVRAGGAPTRSTAAATRPRSSAARCVPSGGMPPIANPSPRAPRRRLRAPSTAVTRRSPEHSTMVGARRRRRRATSRSARLRGPGAASAAVRVESGRTCTSTTSPRAASRSAPSPPRCRPS